MSTNEANEEHEEAVFVGQESAPRDLSLTILRFICCWQLQDVQIIDVLDL